MDWDASSVIESVGGLEEFERLVERGRQLHNQAVFGLITWLVSSAMLSLKKSGGNAIRNEGPGGHCRGVPLNQTSKASGFSSFSAYISPTL